MTVSTQPASTFAYQAQTHDGQPISGTIDAPTAEEASRQLESLHLRVLELQPTSAPFKTKALRGDDFVAFNQQLGYLTAAGMPVERGLRLIAEDMRSGRLAATVRQIADELDKGVPLPTALEMHQGQFPSTYGRLIDAGIKANNLPGMLFNLSRHIELVRRLQAMLWRSFAYPLMVMIGLVVVITFLGWYVLPQFRALFAGWKVQLPLLTQLVLSASKVLPAIAAAVLSIIIATPLIGLALRHSGLNQKLADALLLPMPFIGPVLKRNLLAGWCDALKLGVEAGLDLPTALRLAGDVCASPTLQDDSQALITTLEAGNPLGAMRTGRLLPPAAIAAISLGIDNRSLPETLQSLTQMYQEQAEMRLSTLPGILSPLLLLLAAASIALVIMALFLPLLEIIRWAGGGLKL
jgi:type II secretory pathway component PulF